MKWTIVWLALLAGCSAFAPSPAPTFTYDEIIEIPLNSSEAVLSQQNYSGWVFLHIMGSGSISSDIVTDAFCRYDSDNQILYEGISEYGIMVDGHVRLFTADTMYIGSTCQHDYQYWVAYRPNADLPGQIAFRSVDTTISDNTGSFVVRISRNRPPELSHGR